MITIRMMMNNGRERVEQCRTLAEARTIYNQNLSRMAYGAIYETNSDEEERLAENLFINSEAEMRRRAREMENAPSAEELFLNGLLGR